VAFLPFSYHFGRQILNGTPLRIEHADMLPIIGVMCHRFLVGQWSQVYQPIPEIWNGIQPIYLPAMWLPFSIASLLHFDMRWTTVSCIWLCIILCILPLWKRNVMIIPFLLSLLILLVWLHFDKDNNVIRLTEEGVVFFYYSLMAVSIISYNPYFIGVAAASCLLSRYAIIGWIPFALIYLLTTRQYKFLLKSFVTGTVIVALLIFPFGWHSLLFQFDLPANYIQHAQKVFTNNPEYFYRSLGMAKFFVPDHLQLLHYTLLTSSFLIPIIFLIVTRKKFASVNVLLAGFQLTVTFFYNFLDVSYLYLYYTPVFVSVVIVAWSMQKE
jgi:hypothetical protein